MSQKFVPPYSNKDFADVKTNPIYGENSDSFIKAWKEANEDYVVLQVDGEITNYLFHIGGSMYDLHKRKYPDPPLPLKGYGELYRTGWDIPTRWAIDASGQCWKDGAHGMAMHRCTPSELIAAAEKEEDKNIIRKILGTATSVCCHHCGGRGWIYEDRKKD